MDQLLKVLLLLFMVLVSPRTAILQELTAESILAEVNSNLSNARFSANVNYIDSLAKTPGFKAMDCHQKGTIYHKLGVSHYQLNHFLAAKSVFRDSVLSVWDRCAGVSPGEQGKTLFNIGIVNQYLNQYNEGKLYLDQALVKLESDTDISITRYVRYYRDIAAFYFTFNDYTLATLYLQKAKAKAMDILDEIDRRVFLADLNYQWGKVHRARAEYGPAQEKIQAAIDLREPLLDGAKDVETFKYYHGLAAVYFDQQRFLLAEQTGRSSLRFIDPAVDSVRLMETYEIFAEVNKTLQKPDASMTYHQNILDFSVKNLNYSEDYMRLARTYANMAELDTMRQDYSRALERVEQALSTLRLDKQSGTGSTYTPSIKELITVDRHQYITTLALKAEILSQKYERGPKDVKDLTSALLMYQKIDSLFSAKIMDLRTEDSQLDYLESVHLYYGRAIETCLALYRSTDDEQYAEQALLFASKTKALILLNTVKVDQVISEMSDSTKSQNRINQSSRVNELYLALYDQTLDYDSISSLYFSAQRELSVINESLLSESDELSFTYQNLLEPLRLDEVQSALASEDVLVEYFWTDDQLHQFWISTDDYIIITREVDDQQLQLMHAFIGQCGDPATSSLDILSKGKQLYDYLLGEGLAQMNRSAPQLIIIPDGPLYSIAYDALSQDGKDYLLSTIPTAYSYSNRLLSKSILETEQAYVGYGTAYSARFNERIHQQNIIEKTNFLPALQLTEQEMDTGAKLWGGAHYLNERSTKAHFLQQASSSILHLSLHGIVDDDLPANSCILFDDRAEDFILRASEMYTRGEPHDLVILSSCHSASGKIYRGEGVQGMSKAFLVSGANTVLSSLWSASEQSSLQIISHFLHSLKKGSSRQSALWEAKKKYVASASPVARHPYYWANYVLIGDASLVIRQSFPIEILLGSGLAILMLVLYFLLKRKV